MSANELVAREIEAMTERICRVREEYAGTERTSTPATRGARRPLWLPVGLFMFM